MRQRQRKKNYKKWSKEISEGFGIDLDRCELCGKPVVWNKKFTSYKYTCDDTHSCAVDYYACELEDL